MKITLINPKHTAGISVRSHGLPEKIQTLLEENPKLREKLDFSQSAMSSLGLLCIAAMIPEHIDIEFYDENMETLNLDQEFDLVAIGGNTGQMDRALAICDQLSARGIPMVVGGPAVTTFPDQYTRRGVHVILGEGELLFQQFLEDYLRGEAQQIYRQNESKKFVNLMELPLPRYDLAAKYPYSMVGIQITRGCPYDCSFCQVTRIYGTQYRRKTIRQGIEEIKLVKKLWGDSFLFFYDDNPFFNTKFAIELFTQIHEEKIILGRWGANANVTLYKETELIDLMTKQGPISFLGIGLEALSPEVLETINNSMKVKHLDEYELAIQEFKKKGINPVGYFMYGFEGSKKEDLKEIVDFCLRNELDSVLTRVTPLPGTLLYEGLKIEYEQTQRPIRKSDFAEFGLIRKYFNEKTGNDEEQTKRDLADVYAILYSDQHCDHSDGPIPFYFLF